MATFPYDLNSLNLDGMTPEDLSEVANHLETLAKYARHKGGAMTQHAKGRIITARGYEDTADRLYAMLPDNWRW